jgi:hypothetical protein
MTDTHLITGADFEAKLLELIGFQSTNLDDVTKAAVPEMKELAALESLAPS